MRGLIRSNCRGYYKYYISRMKQVSIHILRVGLAITFLWIGFSILREPVAWGGYLQPWALKLLPIPLPQAMMGTAVLDIALGVLLLSGVFTFFAALAGALHIVLVLIVSGITDITARDIGLLAGMMALTLNSLPVWIDSRSREYLEKLPQIFQVAVKNKK